MVSLHAAFLAMALTGAGQTVLLDFYSDSCGPCQAMAPKIQALEAKGYPVHRVDIAKLKNKLLVAKYKVDPIPCFVMVVDGKEVARAVGGQTTSEQLEQMCLMAKSPGQPSMLVQLPGQATRDASVLQGAMAPSRSATALPSNTATQPMAASHMPAAMPPGLSPMQKDATAAVWQGTPNGVSVTPASFQQSAEPVSETKLLAASVRIRVQDPNGFSNGSGTIVDSRNRKALILTCGHIFRDSGGHGAIEIDLFGPNGQQRVPGHFESMTLDGQHDVALVSIETPFPVTAIHVAPPSYRLNVGQPVLSVGCSNGDLPTVRRSQINGLNKYIGYTSVADQPVEGRSGGGLFSTDGFLIGVCNCAGDQEGLYATLPLIYGELDKNGWAFVYNTPHDATNAVVPAVATNAVPSNAASSSLFSIPGPVTQASATLPSQRASIIPAPQMPSQMPGTALAATQGQASSPTSASSSSASSPAPMSPLLSIPSSASTAAPSPSSAGAFMGTESSPAGISNAQPLATQQIATQQNVTQPNAMAASTGMSVPQGMSLPQGMSVPQGMAAAQGTAAPLALGNLAAPGANLQPHEQAFFNDIHQRAKQGATVVCIVNNPDGQSEVLMIDNASPELRKQLSSEGKPKNTPYPTSSKEPPPRKTILKWEADPKIPNPNTAWKVEGAK